MSAARSVVTSSTSKSRPNLRAALASATFVASDFLRNIDQQFIQRNNSADQVEQGINIRVDGRLNFQPQRRVAPASLMLATVRPITAVQQASAPAVMAPVTAAPATLPAPVQAAPEATSHSQVFEVEIANPTPINGTVVEWAVNSPPPSAVTAPVSVVMNTVPQRKEQDFSVNVEGFFTVDGAFDMNGLFSTIADGSRRYGGLENLRLVGALEMLQKLYPQLVNEWAARTSAKYDGVCNGKLFAGDEEIFTHLISMLKRGGFTDGPVVSNETVDRFMKFRNLIGSEKQVETPAEGAAPAVVAEPAAPRQTWVPSRKFRAVLDESSSASGSHSGSSGSSSSSSSSF